MYPAHSPQQLRTMLRSLRQARGLTQAQLGQRIGVTQKRIARIEAAPEVTAYDQISRIVTALGCRLVIEEQPSPGLTEPDPNSW